MLFFDKDGFLRGPLWTGAVAPDKVLSIAQ